MLNEWSSGELPVAFGAKRATVLVMNEIVVDPEILGGIPVFAGTRVPVRNLFDYLEAGDSLTEFIAAFPDVTREQAVAVLESSKVGLMRAVACAS